MAEEKTFRYGLIVLGFFLVMVGMFIMSVEKPQIYITFCTLGILTVAVGVTWSMCQCYPKIRVVSVDAESERFLVKKPTASSIENPVPEKNSSQMPYTSQKEADVYEKSLPSYEQVQKNMAAAPVECLGALPVAPIPLVRAEGHSQPIVQAKAEVHRNSESDGDACRDPGSQKATIKTYSQPMKFQSQAPLASLQEEMDASSMESTPNSPLLQKWKVAASAVSPTESQLRFKLPCYEDFALIDSVMVEDQNQSMTPDQSHCFVPGPAGEGTAASEQPRVFEHKAIQNVEEDDMYYGIKDGPEDDIPSAEAAFKRKD
uniref:Barttin n=1 Tax=Pogona vitticeps TaxID=103695 RepID=A0A6J0U5U8_9SAUR